MLFPLITENHRKYFCENKIKMLNNRDKVGDVTTPYKYDSFECYRLFAMSNYVRTTCFKWDVRSVFDLCLK